MSIIVPGQLPNVNMEDIRRQEAMRQAIIERTMIDSGSRIFANLVANYYLTLPIGAKVDINRVRQLASVSKELAMFYGEAQGMLNLQVQNESEPGEAA